MRKLIFATIVCMLFVIGIVVYTEWDKKKFVESLPKPPTVEQSVNTPVHRHDAPVPETPSEAVESEAVEDESMAEENTDTGQILPDDDWRTDDVPPHGHKRSPTSDPFGQAITQRHAESRFNPEEMDPDELADMLLHGLIERFGDIPEVHTFMALQRKRLKEMPLTLDEEIERVTTQLYLFPHPETRKTLEFLKDRKASGAPNRLGAYGKGTTQVR